MKKIISLLLIMAIVSFAVAQTKKDQSKITLTDRAADHLMIQLSTDHWANLPDTINSHQKGFSRGLNIYLMLDKPFKSNPKYSVAFGLGIGSSNIFFKNMTVNLAAPGTMLPFDTTTHFKKYKLVTSFLEAPVELRYTPHPERENKSLKLALGVKVGLLLNAHTKGKNLENGNGEVINAYTKKESKTIFFNNTRLLATARAGYGNLSLFGAYQVTPYFKNGSGPDIKFFQIGLCISGL